ncbi:DUF4175 domain-containing protein [Isosphaeraceae bacterium EP7]
MTSPSRPAPPTERRRICLAAGLVAALLIANPTHRGALAQDPKAADVFDEEKPEKAKEETPKPETPKEESPKPGETKPTEVPKAKAEEPAQGTDSIGFTQENVASQMTELEERMFRLSEALRTLEPENASRLNLALKFSREELILHQMRDTQKLLKEAQLSKAETEAKELLAKLEHLRNLLLAEDLDFQMKLARLRQIRESLAQLDRIIKDEKREMAWSRTALETQAELEQLKARKADLEALVLAQGKVIADTKAVPAGAEPPAREALRGREAEVRKSAAKLAADPLFATQQPAHLKQADEPLEDALTNLAAAEKGKEAVADEEKAQESFRKELERLNGRIEEATKAVAADEFRKSEIDQARNRSATDSLGKASARLGNTGVALQKDLIRAGGSMQSAEGDLAKTEAEPASKDQLEALKHLTKGRDELAKASESLLTELRGELQTRIIAELAEMHEIQVSIRETTQAQAPRVAQKSRTALILLSGLSQKEGELASRTNTLRVLTEEIEFGIALPTALGVLSRQMVKASILLKEGDASPATIALEIRIEEDLLSLAEAMRRLSPTKPPPPGTPLPSNPRDRERELNRLVAELKMIRLLQTRLNDDTVAVDGTRPGAATIPPALRREIEALNSAQEEIRDSLSKISEQLEPPPESDNPLLNPDRLLKKREI